MKSTALAKRSPIIGVATLAQAKAMDAEAIAIVGEMESSWLRLGKIVKRVFDSKAYKALGFDTETAWLEARIKGSVSGARAALRSVRYLEGVPDEKLLGIGTLNAQTLTYLPEELRKSDEWLDKAAATKTDDFKEIVLEKCGMKSDPRTWSLCVSKDVLTLLEGAEEKFARSWGLNIEERPGLRSIVWEKIAVFLLQVESIEGPNEAH